MRRHLLIVAALLAMAVGGVAWAAAGSGGTTRSAGLEFDIAEDHTRFVFSAEHTYEDGLPKYGSYFVTQGYLYPKGTLNGTDGVTADGKPAFPDKVLGQWTCWGVFVGEGAKTTTGPWVVATQLFQLGPKFGRRTIVTDGYELTDIGLEFKRAITGGTGSFADARGHALQTLLGFSEFGGMESRTRLIVTS